MKYGYVENIPDDAASSSCCWRLWGNRVVEVFFLIAMVQKKRLTSGNERPKKDVRR